MAHNKDIQAKVKENTIKSKKVEIEKETKYESTLIVRISNFRKLDSNINHVHYFMSYQAK